ncbi:T-complex protein 11-domain-containing protein, partial [Piptocephalis cylindrospora]
MQRRDRLRSRRLSRQAAVASRQEALRLWRSSRLQLALETASHRRLRLLQSQKSRCAGAVAHAKEVARTNRERRAREASVLIQDWWRRQSLARLFREFRAAGGSMARVRAASSFPAAARLSPAPPLIPATLLGRILLLSQATRSKDHQEEGEEEPMRRVRNRTRTFLSSFLLLAYPEDTLVGMSGEEEEKVLTGASKRMLGRLRTLERRVIDQDRHPPPKGFDPILEEGGASEIKAFTQAWKSYHRSFLSWKVQDRQALLHSLRERYHGLSDVWRKVQGQEDQDAWRVEVRAQQEALVREAYHLAAEQGVCFVEGVRRGDHGEERQGKGKEREGEEEEAQSPINDPSIVQITERIGSSTTQDSVVAGMGEFTGLKPQERESSQNKDIVAKSIGWDNIDLVHALCVDPCFNLERFEKDQAMRGSVRNGADMNELDEEEEEEDETSIQGIRLDSQGNIMVKDAKEARRIQKHLEEVSIRAIGDKVAQAWEKEEEGTSQANSRVDWVNMMTRELRSKLQALLPSSSGQSNGASAMGQGSQKLSQDIEHILGEESVPMEAALSSVRSGPGKVEVAQILSQTMTHLVARMCAPVRDQEVRRIIGRIHAWSSSPMNEGQGRELVEIFREILQALDAMKQDLRQYQVESLIPILRECGVEYERTKFRDILVSSSSPDLEKTQAWLKVSAKCLSEERAQRDPEGIQAPEAKIRYGEVYTLAFLNLLLHHPSSSTTQHLGQEANGNMLIPETLVLDTHRIRRWSRKLRHITMACSLALLMRNVSGRIRGNASPELGRDLVQELIVLLRRVSLERTKEEEEDEGTKSLILFIEKRVGQVTRIDKTNASPSLPADWARSMVQRVTQGREPVHGLLTRRIRALFTHWLSLPEDSGEISSNLHQDEERRRRKEGAERQGLTGVYDELERVGLED